MPEPFAPPRPELLEAVAETRAAAQAAQDAYRQAVDLAARIYTVGQVAAAAGVTTQAVYAMLGRQNTPRTHG